MSTARYDADPGTATRRVGVAHASSGLIDRQSATDDEFDRPSHSGCRFEFTLCDVAGVDAHGRRMQFVQLANDARLELESSPECAFRRLRTSVPDESGHSFRLIPDTGGDGADDVQWAWGSVVTSSWQTIGASRFPGSMGLPDGF